MSKKITSQNFFCEVRFLFVNLLVVLFTEFSLEELNNLNNGDDEECKTERNKVCLKVKVSKAEEI